MMLYIFFNLINIIINQYNRYLIVKLVIKEILIKVIIFYLN